MKKKKITQKKDEKVKNDIKKISYTQVTKKISKTYKIF